MQVRLNQIENLKDLSREKLFLEKDLKAQQVSFFIAQVPSEMTLSFESKMLASIAPFEADQRRYQNIVNRQSKATFLISRYLLSELTGETLSFNYGENGKPEFANKKYHFNFSHSEDLVFLGISKNWLVGVDIEKIDARQIPRGRQSAFFSKEEKSWLKDSMTQEDLRSRFLQLWTLKEASVKALGTGLGETLPDFAYHRENNPYDNESKMGLKIFNGQIENKAVYSAVVLDPAQFAKA